MPKIGDPKSVLIAEPNLLIPGKKPIGPVKLAEADRHSFFYLFDDKGGDTIRDKAGKLDGQIIWSGSETQYFNWAVDGLENTQYDSVSTDGAGIKINAHNISVANGYIIGFQERYTGGGFSVIAGFGDNYTSDAAPYSYGGYNNFYFAQTDIKQYVGNRILIATAGRITTVGSINTYVGVGWSDTNNHCYIFRNGQLIASDDTLSANTAAASSTWAIGSLHNAFNRGFNSVLRCAFLLENTHDLELGRRLSSDPYQFLEPA